LKQELLLCNVEDEIAELRTLLDDPELAVSVQAEIDGLEEKRRQLEKKLATFDPDDEKNAIVEIQAGVGGDEAALFVADLYKMYEAYCKSINYVLDCSDFSPGNTGGFKSIQFIIEGEQAFKHFKYESGVHRVQRVPRTETKGRIHTSTATVVVIPEQHIEQVNINKIDVKMEMFGAGGPGGQSSNTSNCAIRLTHIPTGVTVISRMKSVQANLKFCWKVIVSKIQDMQLQKLSEKNANTKKQYRGQASRSDKIRTYNYHDDRVTDHRIEGGKYSLQTIIVGKLDQLIKDVAEQLEAQD
jgi:peptide chain release factor 1